MTSGDEFTVSGDGLTELFVTNGGLCGPNVSYLINPHSRMTIKGQSISTSAPVFNFTNATTSMYVPLLAGFA